MNTNTITEYFDKAVQLNDRLLALPALPLVVLGLLALGYALKAMPFIRNNHIPAWNGLAAILGYELLGLAAVPVESNWQVWAASLTRNFFLAVVAWGIAWRFHAKVLRRWESGDTEFTVKPPSPPPPNR